MCLKQSKRITKTQIPKLREELLEERGDNNCPLLEVELNTHKAVSPVLDHDHKSGDCRDVISLNANSWIGRVENSWFRFCDKHTQITLPEALRNLADYLEKDYSSMPEHPEFVASKKRRVRRWKNETLEKKIKEKGVEVPEDLSRRKLVDLYVEVCT